MMTLPEGNQIGVMCRFNVSWMGCFTFGRTKRKIFTTHTNLESNGIPPNCHVIVPVTSFALEISTTSKSDILKNARQGRSIKREVLIMTSGEHHQNIA